MSTDHPPQASETGEGGGESEEEDNRKPPALPQPAADAAVSGAPNGSLSGGEEDGIGDDYDENDLIEDIYNSEGNQSDLVAGAVAVEEEEPQPTRPTKKRRRTGNSEEGADSEGAAGRAALAASSATSLQEKWDEMFGRLVRYKQIHGNCLVPNRYKEDPSLGSWVATQRRTYKILTSGGSASSGMNVDRARRLMELGFEWATTDPRHVPWEERFEELKAFVTANGHAEVPMRWEENVQLSNWVSKQRQDYKLLNLGKTTRLTEKRRRLLNELGFVWEIPRKGRRLRTAKPVQSPSTQATSTSVGTAAAGVAAAQPVGAQVASTGPSFPLEGGGSFPAQGFAMPQAFAQSLLAMQSAAVQQSQPNATFNTPGLMEALGASMQANSGGQNPQAYLAIIVALAQLFAYSQAQQAQAPQPPAPVQQNPLAQMFGAAMNSPAQAGAIANNPLLVNILQAALQQSQTRTQSAQPQIPALNQQLLISALSGAQGHGATITPTPPQHNSGESSSSTTNTTTTNTSGSNQGSMAAGQQQAQLPFQFSFGPMGLQVLPNNMNTMPYQPTVLVLPFPPSAAGLQQQQQQQQQPGSQQVFQPNPFAAANLSNIQQLLGGAGGGGGIDASGLMPDMLRSLGFPGYSANGNASQQQAQQQQRQNLPPSPTRNSEASPNNGEGPPDPDGHGGGGYAV